MHRKFGQTNQAPRRLFRHNPWAVVAATVGICFLLSATATAATPFGGTDGVVRAAKDTETINFVLTLPPTDQAGMDLALQEMYDPNSPDYRNFLSPEEFNAKYAPSEASYAALIHFAKKSGLAITGEDKGRTMLDVAGNAAAIRRLFKAQMYWRQTPDGKQYLAPDRESSLPSDLIAIGGNVAALNQRPFRPSAQPATGTPPYGVGSGVDGEYAPADIRVAYNLDNIENGGEPVALFEGSEGSISYSPSEGITYQSQNSAQFYAAEFGLPSPTITPRTIANCAGTGTQYQVEVALDIEMLMAAASPPTIYVYSCAPDASGWLAAFDQMAEDNLAGEVSVSWTQCESTVGASTLNAENSVLERMAMQGIAVFAAAGDQGEYSPGCSTTKSVGDPASQPYVTAVGGTSLTTTANAAYYVTGYVRETVWNDSSGATGGGVSQI